MRERTLVQLPNDLALGIDKLVGSGNRSSFTADVVRRELKRREQQIALRAASGSWKDEDHPELAQGGAEYVEKIRSEEALAEEARLNKLASAHNA